MCIRDRLLWMRVEKRRWVHFKHRKWQWDSAHQIRHRQLTRRGYVTKFIRICPERDTAKRLKIFNRQKRGWKI